MNAHVEQRKPVIRGKKGLPMGFILALRAKCLYHCLSILEQAKRFHGGFEINNDGIARNCDAPRENFRLRPRCKESCVRVPRIVFAVFGVAILLVARPA
jgi:hypothetical protein